MPDLEAVQSGLDRLLAWEVARPVEEEAQAGSGRGHHDGVEDLHAAAPQAVRTRRAHLPHEGVRVHQILDEGGPRVALRVRPAIGGAAVWRSKRPAA